MHEHASVEASAGTLKDGAKIKRILSYPLRECPYAKAVPILAIAARYALIEQMKKVDSNPTVSLSTWLSVQLDETWAFACEGRRLRAKSAAAEERERRKDESVSEDLPLFIPENRKKETHFVDYEATRRLSRLEEKRRKEDVERRGRKRL